MRIFLTGANGWMGSEIARDLLAAGHTVTGLVRTQDNAEAVARAGLTPLVGTVGDMELIRHALRDMDGVIHTAFGLDIANIGQIAMEDRQVIEAFGAAFQGSSRPIVVTSGIFMMPPGVTATEATRQAIPPDFPRASEQTAAAIADEGVHASVVRLPRSVHGQGERHGFVPMLANIARATGVSAYVADGANLWPAVHRVDAARVFRLALEQGERNATYHAIAEEGVPFRQIAEAIGRQTGVPARSLTPAEADVHFGPLAVWVAGNGPASSAQTRAALGWTPRASGIVEDIGRADYSA